MSCPFRKLHAAWIRLQHGVGAGDGSITLTSFAEGIISVTQTKPLTASMRPYTRRALNFRSMQCAR